MSHSGVVDDGSTLTQSEVHDVLRNERRRHVIERLAEQDTDSVRNLAEHIASIESGESPPPRNVRQSVYVSLHQTHLPKLDDLAIVVYDDDAKEVWLSDRADEVLVYLDGDADEEAPPWAAVDLGLAVVGLLGAGVGLAADLPGIAVGLPVLALLGVGAVAGYRLADEAGVELPPGDGANGDRTDTVATGGDGGEDD
jgi:predicted transcriptional regulator